MRATPMDGPAPAPAKGRPAYAERYAAAVDYLEATEASGLAAGDTLKAGGMDWKVNQGDVLATGKNYKYIESADGQFRIVNRDGAFEAYRIGSNGENGTRIGTYDSTVKAVQAVEGVAPTIREVTGGIAGANEETYRSKRAHFDGKYRLKKNNEYVSNGYHYKTDANGRIISAKGYLVLIKGIRNKVHQLKAGGKYRLASDQGGHIFGTRFNGSSLVDNIVAMDKNVNLSKYKQIENIWEKALEKNQQVYVEIDFVYQGDSLRPSSFNVKYKINGETFKIRIKNK